MCVPNLVPIGPQTATCIRLEGYRHTLSYIDIEDCIVCLSLGRPHDPLSSVLPPMIFRNYLTLGGCALCISTGDLQHSLKVIFLY